MSMSALPGERARPLVTVILPTHSHASTIDLAGRSVLEQSVHSLELVVIGDGATPEVKAAVALLAPDERVRFIDRPKSSSRAELVRDEVLREATSPYVCYLGDDDIMLPGHLADTLDRLADVDFTHPLPVFIDRQGKLQAHLTDLADPRCRLWHEHPLRNAVSLTGVGHRLDAYRRLPHGWRETPAGRWSDHYMWQQWFASPGFRYATGDRLTMLKFAAADRTGMTDEQRRAEIVAWLEPSRQPGFDDCWPTKWLTRLGARQSTCASSSITRPISSRSSAALSRHTKPTSERSSSSAARPNGRQMTEQPRRSPSCSPWKHPGRGAFATGWFGFRRCPGFPAGEQAGRLRAGHPPIGNAASAAAVPSRQ